MPPAPRSCTASPALPLAPTRRQACSRPDCTEPPSVSPAPSLTHVMLWDSPPLHAGFVGKATPAGFRPSVIPPHLRPLSSTGITPRLQYYGPLRHPVGPACPSRGSGCRVHGTDRGSRVATPSIFHACRRHYPGGNRPVRSSLSSRPAGGLPLITVGSASALSVSRPARRSLAFRPAWSLSRPRRPFSPESFNPCRCLHEPPWPLPAGTTVAGWGSHPPGKRAFPRRTVMSAYSVANSVVSAGGWVWAAIAFSTATVAASVVPLVYRYGDAISSAAHCQTRLDSLSTKCKELWLLRDAIDEEEAISRWRALEGEQTEITAFQSARPLDHKLAVSTRKETDAYWKQEADRLNRIAEKGSDAIQTAGQRKSIEGGSDPTPAQA